MISFKYKDVTPDRCRVFNNVQNIFGKKVGTCVKCKEGKAFLKPMPRCSGWFVDSYSIPKCLGKN